MRLRGALLAGLFVNLSLFGIAAVTADDVGPGEEVFFATAEELGQAGASFRLSADEATECALEMRSAGRSDGASVRIRTMESSEHGLLFWGASSSSSSLVHAHVEDLVDTREHTQGGGWGASVSRITFPVSGTIELTVVGSHLSPWPDELLEDWPFEDFPPPEHSIAFGAECEGPVDVELSGARELAILTPLYASSGVGAWVALVGNVLVGGHEGGDVTAPEVRFRSGSFGEQAGVMTLEHPEGEETWALSPATPGFVAVDGGPGEYGFEVSRVGVRFEAFWSFLAGMHPVDDLDEVADLPGL